MLWLLVPLCWTLASITIMIGFNGFLRAEADYVERLDRASDRARRKVDWEMRPQAEKDAEAAMIARQMADMQNAAYRQTNNLAWAQSQSMLGLNCNQHATFQGHANMLGLRGLFG